MGIIQLVVILAVLVGLGFGIYFLIKTLNKPKPPYPPQYPQQPYPPQYPQGGPQGPYPPQQYPGQPPQYPSQQQPYPPQGWGN